MTNTITMNAARCAGHFDESCQCCIDAEACTNTELERLRGENTRLRAALSEVYKFADNAANGVLWHFRDQPCAQKARAALTPAPAHGASSTGCDDQLREPGE